MDITASAAARSAYYDRTPASQFSRANIYISENQAEVTRWTYTVPTGKKAKIGVMEVGITVRVLATTTDTTFLLRSTIQITPSGGATDVMLEASVPPAVSPAGTRELQVAAPDMTLVAGDALTGVDAFQGAVGGAGRAQSFSNMTRTEFDA